MSVAAIAEFLRAYGENALKYPRCLSGEIKVFVKKSKGEPLIHREWSMIGMSPPGWTYYDIRIDPYKGHILKTRMDYGKRVGVLPQCGDDTFIHALMTLQNPDKMKWWYRYSYHEALATLSEKRILALKDTLSSHIQAIRLSEIFSYSLTELLLVQLSTD